MTNKSRIKIIITFIFLIALSVALYLRRPKDTWNPGWDKGFMSKTERIFYYNRINRIINEWQQTNLTAERNRIGELTESYQIYFVIDLDKKALWIENNGQIMVGNYIEFPLETNWTLYHSTSEDCKELEGRTILKIRSHGLIEKFALNAIGAGGYLHFNFSSSGRGGSHGSGSYTQPVTKLSSTKKLDKSYRSILVTEDEYKKYKDSLPETSTPLTENENKKAWSRIEKYLYMEIERQLLKNGFENLGEISVNPGPDYSAAHAEFRTERNDNFIRRIFSSSPSIEAYLKIDYLENDNWYVKSTVNPNHPLRNEKPLGLEFLVSANGFGKGSKNRSLIKKGRNIQKAFSIPESKSKATLSNGTTIEFLGICENPSHEKRWWGPDGTLVDYVPYINTKPYDRSSEDRKIYEFVWRIMPPTGMGCSFEGNNGSYSHRVYDRYGNNLPKGLQADGFSFDKSRQVTTAKFSLAMQDWRTIIQIDNKTGATINFLDKQQIQLNPPEIENGEIVIRCYDEFRIWISGYKTDFGLIYYEDMESKTVSLNRYEEDITDHQDTGMREHKYVIHDLNISQIEGVCFRYQPYSFVLFKNISLVPGQDQGFEIEVIEAEE